MLTGACLCGALHYDVEGVPQSLMHCHCSRCRKHHGAPFATHVLAPAAGFRWQGEEPALIEHRSSATRVRRACAVCGSVAPTLLGDRVLLPAGNLLGELTDVAGLHMFVGSKTPSHVIGDSLPQHRDAPPGWPLPERVDAAPVQLEGAIHGSCACGDVSFAVSGAPARWFQCHCSRCRRGRSAAHGSNTFYPSSQFQWRAGRELVRSYKPLDAERFTVSFCVRCGGGAPVERDNVPFVLIPVGLLDGAPPGRPTAHIYVASKAPWYPFNDGLLQYAESPPA
jgi:hypothetical protein